MRKELMREGRLAGLLYLVVVLTGIFSLAYVPGRIGVAGDPHATLANVTAQTSLFRWGIAAFMVGQVAFLLLALALYRNFRGVDRVASLLMAVFAAIGVPIALAALSNRLEVLALLGDPVIAGFVSAEQREVAAYLALKAYSHGLHVAQLFWGLWLLPLGWLVLRSGRLPRVLGVLLVLGCFGYLINVFAALLVPGYSASAIHEYVRLPASLGEIGTCLWLLLFGLRAPAGSR